MTKYDLQMITIPQKLLIERVLFLCKNYEMFRCEAVFFQTHISSLDVIRSSVVPKYLHIFYVVEPLPMVTLADYGTINSISGNFLYQHLPNIINVLSALHSVSFSYLNLSPFSIIVDDSLSLRPPPLNPFASPKSSMPPPPKVFRSYFRTINEQVFYRAPEWNSIKPFCSSDTWSVGCILGEFFCFEGPMFGSLSPEDQMRRTQMILGPAPQFLKWVPYNSNVNNDLPELIIELLNYDPHKRPVLCSHLNQRIIKFMLKYIEENTDENGSKIHLSDSTLDEEEENTISPSLSSLPESPILLTSKAEELYPTYEIRQSPMNNRSQFNKNSIHIPADNQNSESENKFRRNINYSQMSNSNVSSDESSYSHISQISISSSSDKSPSNVSTSAAHIQQAATSQSERTKASNSETTPQSKIFLSNMTNKEIRQQSNSSSSPTSNFETKQQPNMFSSNSPINQEQPKIFPPKVRKIEEKQSNSFGPDISNSETKQKPHFSSNISNSEKYQQNLFSSPTSNSSILRQQPNSYKTKSISSSPLNTSSRSPSRNTITSYNSSEPNQSSSFTTSPLAVQSSSPSPLSDINQSKIRIQNSGTTTKSTQVIATESISSFDTSSPTSIGSKRIKSDLEKANIEYTTSPIRSDLEKMNNELSVSPNNSDINNAKDNFSNPINRNRSDLEKMNNELSVSPNNSDIKNAKDNFSNPINKNRSDLVENNYNSSKSSVNKDLEKINSQFSTSQNKSNMDKNISNISKSSRNPNSDDINNVRTLSNNKIVIDVINKNFSKSSNKYSDKKATDTSDASNRNRINMSETKNEELEPKEKEISLPSKRNRSDLGKMNNDLSVSQNLSDSDKSENEFIIPSKRNRFDLEKMNNDFSMPFSSYSYIEDDDKNSQIQQTDQNNSETKSASQSSEEIKRLRERLEKLEKSYSENIINRSSDQTEGDYDTISMEEIDNKMSQIQYLKKQLTEIDSKLLNGCDGCDGADDIRENLKNQQKIIEQTIDELSISSFK